MAQEGAGAQPQQQMMSDSTNHQIQQQSPCINFNQNLLSCLKENPVKTSICQTNIDLLTQCKKENSSYYPGF
ncbi:hypothetical protein FGO68_gene14736 [Halteria grandinella]|uniref:CHCH domain-containing protein n=1 Tax=Halteria grandinella TaxID=5974 RepID=A0A8J8SYS2_HALGN|nr:hypothetical protein FGO68_gene14736 [Halteria grandinella]